MEDSVPCNDLSFNRQYAAIQICQAVRDSRQMMALTLGEQAYAVVCTRATGA